MTVPIASGPTRQIPPLQTLQTAIDSAISDLQTASAGFNATFLQALLDARTAFSGKDSDIASYRTDVSNAYTVYNTAIRQPRSEATTSIHDAVRTFTQSTGTNVNAASFLRP